MMRLPPKLFREHRPDAGASGTAWWTLLALILPLASFAEDLRAQLDAPLLFVKRHAYMSGHIYDDYYTWKPGGGIYVIENPSAPPDQRRIRAIIDPQTQAAPGPGVYRDPELSWDAKKIVFAFKGEPEGSTSIYEIGVDGAGLRRLTFPERDCTLPMPVRALGRGRHDISPCYLPDGRIVFTSTRQGARVPCFNSEVDTLHVMDADGGNIHSISVNNVNEFDPAVLPDGRILYGRWEYVDKTALYMQSLWTVFPDGSNETALFGNNLAKPTAILDARPVPDSHLIVAALTPHNGQSVGAIAMIDPRLGKNSLEAIFNFTPEHPTEMDQGLARGPCDPWPVSEDLVLISNNGKEPHAVLELIARDGRRERLHAEPEFGCYSPMLVKPRPVPAVIGSHVAAGEPARFFIQDIYRGLEGVRGPEKGSLNRGASAYQARSAPPEGEEPDEERFIVKRGEIAQLRVIEETARVSGIPPGGRWWNQAFLLSWQGSYTVKNFLGVVPVQEDGSVYFDAPPGRALYFQALDGDGKMVQSMRTFVQAMPGVTRSCIGCHEYKNEAPHDSATLSIAHQLAPATPQPESWGSGFIDYPGMIQPILDRHCVSCHGGGKDIAGGIDLSGGWTWAFNISYETLLKNTLVGFLNCVNEAVKTADVLPPRAHGSGNAPLTQLILGSHAGHSPGLSRAERDLLFAWMDGNCNYHGTWDWTETATCQPIIAAGQRLSEMMQRAGCTECHAPRVGNDWINLQQPELSRILRAPLAAGGADFGLAWCRDRKARDPLPLVASAAQPPDVFNPKRTPPPDPAGRPVAGFASAADETYQAMLQVIRAARQEALSQPRRDMPDAGLIAGEIRHLVAPQLPGRLPWFKVEAEDDAVVALSWERSAGTIGLTFEVHRSREENFAPTEKTRLAETLLFRHLDTTAPAGRHHYALVLKTTRETEERSSPIRSPVVVPTARAVLPPEGLHAVALPGEVQLRWNAPDDGRLRFNVFRAPAGSVQFERIHREPLRTGFYVDADVAPGAAYAYRVSARSRRGAESEPGGILTVMTLPEKREAIFVAPLESDAVAMLEGAPLKGRVNGQATFHDGALDLRDGGNVTFSPQPGFDVRARFSVECWVRLSREKGSATSMPVVVSYGRWNESGWFLQKFRAGWRWHVGGIDCDGGDPAVDAWTHLVATFDGRQAKLIQNGRLVASVTGEANRAPWLRPLFVGQYGASPAAEYQVFGHIAGVKIHHRALSVAEALAAFERSRGDQLE